MQKQDRQRILEILAVILTGVGKFVLVDFFELKFVYIATAMVFWVGFIAFKYRTNSQILEYWGFTRDHFREVVSVLLPLGIISILLFLVIGYQRNTIALNWHLFPILILYPFWGLIQQFIIVALVAGNLNDLEKFRLPEIGIVVITSLIFSFVHYPNTLLMVGTFVLCLVYSKVYLWKKNLYVLGLFHGWLGGLFYFIVLNRDPWVEMFGGFS